MLKDSNEYNSESPFGLLGQQRTAQLLSGLLSGGRFPHALLIEGPAGSGRRTMARYAAALVLCKNGGACMRCSICRRIAQNALPDLSFITPDNRGGSISVARIRQLRDEAQRSPHEAAARVFIIPEAHNMTPAAQNALLKTLEEPPEGVYFILTAPSAERLLPTVVSRCLRISMQLPDAEKRREYLAMLRPDAAPEQLDTAALCETVGEGLSQLDAPSAVILDAQRLFSLSVKRDRYGALVLLAGYENNRDSYVRLMEQCSLAASRSAGRSPSSEKAALYHAYTDAALAARGNAVLPLLSAALIHRLSEI